MAFDVYTWYELSMQFTIQYIYGVEHYFSLFSQGIQSLLVGRAERPSTLFFVWSYEQKEI